MLSEAPSYLPEERRSEPRGGRMREYLFPAYFMIGKPRERGSYKIHSAQYV